mgnify:CR=1 FL=1
MALLVHKWLVLGESSQTDSNENYTNRSLRLLASEKGTSNRYPLLAPGNSGQNFQAISDIYIDDADYVRIQNLTIGYDLQENLEELSVPATSCVCCCTESIYFYRL